jgi:hypothetical protein
MPRRKEDILDRLVSNFSFRGFVLHQATLFVAATVLLIGGVIFLWKNNQSSIVDLADYQLTSEKISLPEPPPWVDLDPRALIIGPESNKTILDPQLVSTTADQVKKMRFVDQINSISKSKLGLEVNIDYRVPVGVVEINERTMRIEKNDPNFKGFKNLKLPIDRAGIIMPAQLAELPNLPIISMPQPVDRLNSLTMWGDWPDQRVRDAAIISRLFAHRPEFGVFRVVTFQEPTTETQSKPFELWGRSGEFGMRIIWGVQSSSQGDKEATAEQKLAAIKSLIERVGPLAPVSGGNGKKLGRVFDVRSGKAIELPRNKVANMPSLTF